MQLLNTPARLERFLRLGDLTDRSGDDVAEEEEEQAAGAASQGQDKQEQEQEGGQAGGA